MNRGNVVYACDIPELGQRRSQVARFEVRPVHVLIQAPVAWLGRPSVDEEKDGRESLARLGRRRVEDNEPNLTPG